MFCWPPHAGHPSADAVRSARWRGKRRAPVLGATGPRQCRGCPPRPQPMPQWRVRRGRQRRSTPMAQRSGERFSSTGFSHTGADPGRGLTRKGSRAAPASEKACTLSTVNAAADLILTPVTTLAGQQVAFQRLAQSPQSGGCRSRRMAMIQTVAIERVAHIGIRVRGRRRFGVCARPWP